MNKKILQSVTGCVALCGVLYAAGIVNVFGTFFTNAPTSGYNCAGYGYSYGYGYGYECTPKTSGGGGGSSIGSSVGNAGTSSNTPTPSNPTTDDSTDDTTPTDDSSNEGNTDDSNSNTDNGSSVDSEVKGAYDFGFENGLTTQPLAKARLYDSLTRFELAKMMSAFIKNVEGKEAVENPTCDITKYSDYSIFDSEMKTFIKMACDYGVMGWKNDKSDIIATFRPNDTVTREEFAAVLSRYLFGNKYDGQPMSAHLVALKDAEIMNKIDNPYVTEVRGYVLLMLQRVAEAE